MKYKEWLDVWLENYVRPFAKPRTTESYARIIEQRLNAALGEKEMSELTAVDMQLLVTELMRRGNRITHGGLAASTVNTVITVMQSSLKTAVNAGLIGANAARGVRRPRVGYRKPECFTVPEQKKIEAAVLYGGYDKMFGVVLCLYTGLRIGELLALEWSDIDLKAGLIAVGKARRKNGNGLRRTENTVVAPRYPRAETDRRVAEKRKTHREIGVRRGVSRQARVCARVSAVFRRHAA